MTRREAYEYGVEQLEAEGIENAECDIISAFKAKEVDDERR